MRPIQIIAVVLLFAVAAFGQTNRGGIAGTVLDQNGAAIPGATVTVTNIGTGQKQTVTTSEDGAFQVSSLDPVTYSITVEAQGFKTATVQSLKVDTATTVPANVIMEAGAVGEQVTVVADAPLINTESGTATTTVTERQIQDIPLNNRSVLDLAVTAPNVTGDVGSEDPGVSGDQPVPGFNLNVNGGRSGSTAILADGVNNTGVGIARSVVSFTPETVQEFTVQTSAYSAEFGNTGGGVINATTKSGTNDFHGVALWYHRNPKFNATPFTIGSAPRPRNNLRYNQVSLTAGGPIILPKFGEGGDRLYNGRNKSFFFVAYEPRWRQDFLTGSALVPSLAERTGDFRNLVRTASGIVPASVATQFNLTSTGNAHIYQQFVLVQGKLYQIQLAAGNQYCQFNDPRRSLVNNTFNVNGVLTVVPTPQCNSAINAAPNSALDIVPSEFIDPIAVKLLGFEPQPTGYFNDGGVIRNYFVQRSVTQNETRYTLRLDHNFTDNFKANFRYTLTPAVAIRSAGGDINGNQGVYSNARQFLLAFNNILSPSIVNDLRLNYTRGNFSEDYSPEFSILGGRSFARDIGLPALTQGGIPLFLTTQDANSYAGSDIGSAASTNNFNVEQRYNINDIVYWTRGNMTWKFGVDLSDARLSVIPFFAASGGRYSFRTVQTSFDRSGGTTVTSGGNPFASMLLGVPNAVDVRPILLTYDYQWRSGAAFVQNDWKVKPNLTLNLGLRYSLQFPRTERHDLQGVFRPDLAQTVALTDAQRRTLATNLGVGVAAGTPVPDIVPSSVLMPAFAFSGRGGRSRYITPVDYMGFEPRLGFAWQPKTKFFGLDLESRSVVIRGGYGISHYPLTGNNRSPNPDFGGFVTASTLLTTGTTPSAACPTLPIACLSSGTANINQSIQFTTNPPLQSTVGSLDALLGIDQNGLVFSRGLGISAFAIDVNNSGKVPYTANWNLAVQFEPLRNMVIEVAYVGSQGRHLYLPQVNINPRNIDLIEQLEAAGTDVTGNIADPLGRVNLQGGVISITRASVFSQYLGFDPLNQYFDPSASSIRHAAYIDVRRRVSRGLTFTANYTFGKSIDTASDASPDTRVLSTGQARGQVSLGGSLENDRALSAYDVKNNFVATGIWDIPVGRGRRYFTNEPSIVNVIFGGWTMSGVYRMPGGTPFLPFITDPNKLGGTLFNRVVRPDIVPGVPLKNPRWTRNCPSGASTPPTGCEPFINPAAFMRPVKGTLGNAPRSLDIRPPRQEYFDFSFSKDFPWPIAGGEGRRINFRVDLINAFNHPNFRYNNRGNTPFGLGTFPTEITSETVGGVRQPITAAEYNTWATFNGQPLSTTAAGAAQLAAIRANVNATRSNSGAGGLPADFFHVLLPEGFATRDPLSFDIRNLDQYKLYRIRQTYDANFGTLTATDTSPRYIQFGIRIFF
ncbi:MAG TPA: carboxypeptidase regulatory-like domain-containing protein [Pyrinomonadaceae bacterium]|nr:carboxypeptidase regulatory-like domain-containing protein [Pyrinomonadaceae bacterium]